MTLGWPGAACVRACGSARTHTRRPQARGGTHWWSPQHTHTHTQRLAPALHAAAARPGAGQQGRAAPFGARLRNEGLTDEAIAYLSARGLLSERRLAAAAATRAELVEFLVVPFLNGFEVDGVLHKSHQDAVLTRAILVIA